MGYQCFEVEESQGIAHVRLSRGDKANSMIPAFWSELPAIVDEISDAGRARVIVLSAEGRHFCSGMDLSVFTSGSGVATEPGEVGRQRANVRLNLLHLQRSLTALEQARIRGPRRRLRGLGRGSQGPLDRPAGPQTGRAPSPCRAPPGWAPVSRPEPACSAA